MKDKDKVVIFHNLTREELERAMEAVKAALGKDVIMAVTTPISINWKVKDLIKELIEEHRYLRGEK